MVDGADSALLLVGGATSFYHRDPASALREQMDRAFALSGEILLARFTEEDILARKLAKIAWGVFKSGRDFDPAMLKVGQACFQQA